MLRGGIRRFDLYDFFSVFLPGATVLLGIVPFLPKKTKLGPALVGTLIVLGFVVGRGVHSIAITAENVIGGDSHREKFHDEITRNGEFEDLLIDEFSEACNRIYDGFDFDEDSDMDSDTLYTLVRSYVHMDSRGRSRTFQAVYAFHRSMWIVTLSLSLLYALYGVGDALVLFEESVNYLSFIGVLDLPALVLTGGPLLVTSLAYRVSRDGKRRHRKNYVQYLIADFVTLYHAESSTDDEDPAAGGTQPHPRQ